MKKCCLDLDLEARKGGSVGRAVRLPVVEEAKMRIRLPNPGVTRNPPAMRSTAGFTVLEIAIVLAILLIIAAVGFPALQTAMRRAKLEGYARSTDFMIRKARLEAIKTGRQVGVHVDIVNRIVYSFIDTDNSCDPSPGEGVLTAATNGVGNELLLFAGPNASPAIDGFNNLTPSCPPAVPSGAGGGWVIFRSSGEAVESGGFRFGDPNGNFLEVRVAPKATGKVSLLKWNSSTNTWLENNKGGKVWAWY